MTLVSSLEELLVEQLRDLYDAEQQILKALPKLEQQANSQDLKKGFRDHHKETQGQIKRLERIFDELGESPKGGKSAGIEGLIQESEKAFGITDPDIKDAALIVAAQKVEHYEMAGYGSVRSFAYQLGLSNITSLLQETLDQEGATDKRLSKLAEGGPFQPGINQEAQR